MRQNMGQQLNELKKYYLSKLPSKIEAIELTWQDYLEDCETKKLQILYRQTHNMSGSAGAYGYKEIGDVSKKIDRLLRDQSTLDQEKKARITALIVRLKEAYNKIR